MKCAVAITFLSSAQSSDGRSLQTSRKQEPPVFGLVLPSCCWRLARLGGYSDSVLQMLLFQAVLHHLSQNADSV